MNIRKLLAAALIALSVPAAADVATATEAYEVRLDTLRLPGNANGTLGFKACDECDYQTVRVTPETRYEANERSFTLEEFRQELELVEDPSDETVTVMHNLESDAITAVWIRY